MSLLAWLTVAGIAGVYFLIKYGEVQMFSAATDVAAKALAHEWVYDGVALSTVSGSVKALVDVIGEFNDFMDELEDNDFLDEFKNIDPESGLKILPDVHITLPNGMVVKVIDSEAVMDFRISANLDNWMGGQLLVSHVPGTYYYIAYRLTANPNIEFIVPGSDEFMYVDTLDGQTRAGKDCTPPRYLTDFDLEYIASCITLFLFICDFLRATGLTRTLKLWYEKYILKKNFRKLHDSLTDTYDLITELSGKIDINSEVAEAKIETVDALIDTLRVTDFEALYARLRKLGYRPY